MTIPLHQPSWFSASGSASTLPHCLKMQAATACAKNRRPAASLPSSGTCAMHKATYFRCINKDAVRNQPLDNPNWTDETNTPRSGGTVGQLMIARANFVRNMLQRSGVNTGQINASQGGSRLPTTTNRTVTPTINN
jgi:hypothetical protein